jgi:hypothetical protein
VAFLCIQHACKRMSKRSRIIQRQKRIAGEKTMSNCRDGYDEIDNYPETYLRVDKYCGLVEEFKHPL